MKLVNRYPRSLHRGILLLIASACSFVISPMESAQAVYSIGATTSSPVSSTGGGGLANVNCASTGVLSGITGSYSSSDGGVVTYLYGGCATLDSNGSTISSVNGTALGPYGGAGTSAATLDCSTSGGNRVIVGARLYKSPTNGYAAGIQLLCGTLPAGGSRTLTSTTLGTTTGTYQDIACNTGNIARGLYVYYGGILDKFGLNCAPIQNVSQTITFNSIGTASKTWTFTDITSSSSSGLTVTHTSSTTSICTVSGSRVTLVAAGTCTINANQAGDTNFLAATQVSRSFEVLAASPSVSTTNYDKDGSGTGWAASVSTTGGETVTATGANLGLCTDIVAAGGGWTGSIPLTSVTSTSFTFVVPSTSTFYGWIRLNCTGTNFDLNVFLQRTAVPVNTVLPVISGTLRPGQVLSSTNGTWNGTPTSYSYQWSKSLSSSGTYSDIAGATASTYTLTSNEMNYFIKITVTATNLGGSTPSTSIATGMISLVSQTITFSTLGTSSANYPYSQALSMSTTGTSGTGAITYAIFAGGTATGCALSDNTSTATLTASTSGTCLIKATIAADSTYDSATSSALTFTFSRANQSSLSITSTSGSYGTSLTLTTTGGSGSGSITFSYASGTTTCTLLGSSISASAPGTCLITATKAQDDGYSAITSSQTTIIFAYGTSSSTVTIEAGTIYFRQSKLISATASVAGKLTFRSNSSIIPGCKNLAVNASNSFTRSCSFKPANRGYVTLTVTLVPTDTSYSSSSTNSGRLFVNSRSVTR